MPPSTQKISDFMTKSPHMIGMEQPLSHAHDVMRRRRIRHLPVLHGGKLVELVRTKEIQAAAIDSEDLRFQDQEPSHDRHGATAIARARRDATPANSPSAGPPRRQARRARLAQ